MATTEVSTNVSKRFDPFIPLTTIRTVISNIVRDVQEKEAARSEKYIIPVFASADPMAYIPNVLRKFWYPSNIGITVIKPNENFDTNKLPKNGYLLRGFEDYINGKSDHIPTVSFETLATPSGEIILHYTENGDQVFKYFKDLSSGVNIILSDSKGHSNLADYAIELRRDIRTAFREPVLEVKEQTRIKSAEYKEKKLQRNIASALTRIAGNLKVLTKAYLELEEDDKTGLRVLANNSVIDWLIETGVLLSAKNMENWIGDKLVLDTSTGFTYKSTLLTSTYGNRLPSPFCIFTYKNGTEGYEANPWDKKKFLIVREGITRIELKKISDRHLGTYRRKLLKKVMLRGFKPVNDDQSRWEDLDDSSQE